MYSIYKCIQRKKKDGRVDDGTRRTLMNLFAILVTFVFFPLVIILCAADVLFICLCACRLIQEAVLINLAHSSRSVVLSLSLVLLFFSFSFRLSPSSSIASAFLHSSYLQSNELSCV